MQAAKLTKLDMAKKMATSRSQLDRVLDPSNVSVQLDTLIKAARARQRDRDQDQTRHQKGGGMNGARGRALAGLLPKSVMHWLCTVMQFATDVTAKNNQNSKTWALRT